MHVIPLAQCQVQKYTVIVGCIILYYYIIYSLSLLKLSLEAISEVRIRIEQFLSLTRSPELAHLPHASLGPNSDMSLSSLHPQSGIFSEV